MYHIFFIRSSVSGYLSCLYVLAIINGASMNVGTHIFSNYSFIWVYAQE